MLNSNVARILLDESFNGIGAATVRKLVEKFGDNLGEILERGDSRKLCRVVSQSKAITLIDGWRSNKRKATLAMQLDQLGVDSKHDKEIWGIWGEESLDKILQNPYRLLAILNWKPVDALAATIGVTTDSPARLVGAAEHTAYGELDAGDTVISESTLRHQLQKTLPRENDLSFDVENLASASIELAVEVRSLFKFQNGFQIPGAYFAERDVEAWVSDQLHTDQLTEIDGNLISEYFEHDGFSATDEQSVAVKNSLRSRLSIFYGGAGVGKTATIKLVCDAAETLVGKKPILLAIAAKAARRMSEATGRDAMTLAALLYRSAELSNCEHIFVIDEFSMVDLLTFRKFIKRVPSNSHVVLVGDPAQLPSIGPGNLLHDFIRFSAAPTQHLTIVHRQSADTGIPEQLNSIRDGVFPELEAFDWTNPMRPGISMIAAVESAVPKICQKLAATYSGAFQVITPRVKTALGSKALSQSLHKSIIGDDNWLPGTRVIFTSNQVLQSGGHVVNGLIGHVERWLIKNPRADYIPCVVVATDQGEFTLTLSEVRQYLDLAWAISVHKSQGSAWETVIAVLPRDTFLVDRSMVYTALSRCQRRCVCIVTDVDALLSAVSAEPAYSRRKTGLFKLREMT